MSDFANPQLAARESFDVYALLAVTAFFVRSATQPALYVGAVALSLLLFGIHNAWDTVIHVGITSSQQGSQNN